AYLSLVEVLYGYPLDGVVLLTGCDKTTPACLMAAATVNTPAIVLCGGPMLKAGGRANAAVPAWRSGRRARNLPSAVSAIRSSWISRRHRRHQSVTATPWARPRL